MSDVMHSRVLADGSQTVIRLFIEPDFARITATNGQGTSETIVDHADALRCFAHPFSREDWLSYPGVHVKAPRPLARNADGVPKIEVM